MANSESFSYSNWHESKEGIGCPNPKACDESFGLTLDNSYKWKALEKERELPYICVFSCGIGYTWLKQIKKCVKLSQFKKSHSVASLSCAQNSGRLISIQSCSDFEKLTFDLLRISKDITEYWIGWYSYGFDQYTVSDRVSEEFRNWINAKGEKGLDASHGVVCQSENKVRMINHFNLQVSSIPYSLDGYYGSLVYKDSQSWIKYHSFSKEDMSQKNFFICEKETEWSCPNGFMLFQSQCYKMLEVDVTFAQAEILCENQQASLLELQTRMHQNYFTAWLFSLNNNPSKIWIAYRRHTNTKYQAEDNIYLPKDPEGPAFEFQSNNGLDMTVTGQIYPTGDEDCLIMDQSEGKIKSNCTKT